MKRLLNPQNYSGRKQAEKALELLTHATFHEKGKMTHRQEPWSIVTAALRSNQGTPNICLAGFHFFFFPSICVFVFGFVVFFRPARFQSHYGSVSDSFVPPIPPTLLKKLCHLEITREFRVTETRRGQVRGALPLRPASPWIPCLLLNCTLFWLLFTGLIVTIVYVRKLEKPGDFPPLHYLLSTEVSINLSSLLWLYTKHVHSYIRPTSQFCTRSPLC